MSPIADYSIPAARARFMPRNDANTLSSVIEHGWQTYQQTHFPQAERDAVGEACAQHIERFPAADLDTLRRYGFTETVENLSVTIYNARTDRWDNTAGIPLPRKVEVPKGFARSSSGGMKWSRERGRGVTPEYQAEMIADGKWQAFCDDQDRRDAAGLPESLTPYFRRIVDLRNAYRDQYQAIDAWPAAVKAATGRYPTWLEIEIEFPFVGEYLASRRAEADAGTSIDAVHKRARVVGVRQGETETLADYDTRIRSIESAVTARIAA